jgi:hypothetical protein
LEHADVVTELGEPVQRHPPQQASLDRWQLVVLEIHSADRPQQIEQPLHLAVVERAGWLHLEQIGVASHCRELGADPFRRQHQIDHAGGDSGARHAVVLGGVRLLRQGNAAGRLDVADAERAVRSGPGKNHADRARAGRFGKGREERVNWRVLRPVVGTWLEVQPRARDPHLHVRRDHVDAVRLHLQVVGHLDHRHRRVRRQQGRQGAVVLRRQVLHEDDGKAGIRGHPLQQLDERFEAAGRGANADDRER